MPDIRANMNATGFGPQDLRSSDGGNNSRGVLDQIRPTGIMATGGSRRREKSERYSKRGKKGR